MSKNKLTGRKATLRIVTLAVLIALEVVLNRFLSVNTQALKIGVAFLPVAIAGWLYGIPGGMLVGGLADLAGALIFPIGPPNPGITAVAAISGAVYGFFLHPKRGFATRPVKEGGFFGNLLRTVGAVLVKQGICSQLLNTLFIWMIYGGAQKTFGYFFLSRLLTQTVFMVPVEIVLILLLLPALKPIRHLVSGDAYITDQNK